MMTSKVAIDVTSCAYAPLSGTGVYVRNIIAELPKLNRNVEYHLISSRLCDLSWAEGATKWFGKGELSRHNIIWWAIQGNRILSKIGADVFWSPFQFFPIGMSIKRRAILTILDLVWHRMPSAMNRRNYFWNRSMMRRSISKASSVITISNATRDDLINHFTTNDKGVNVIHLSASPEFCPADRSDLEETIYKYPACKNPYLLAVGALEPRKNHLGIVRALEKLRCSGCDNYNLVIVSSSGWRNGEFFDYLNKSHLKDNVYILRDVGQTDLRNIYNMAELLVFPSLMEGFGIPVLEAMACGCPVVTSNRSSMPEVAGDAAVLVDPNDVDNIASGIRQALGRKEELRRLGFERAKQFSWKKSAEQHLNILLN